MMKVPRERPPRTHVFIVDGTLSTLDDGCQTHAGQLYHLLKSHQSGARRTVTYHAGVQGTGWRRWARAALGIGVNDAIRLGYATLASRYRPGDQIFLFGYSRGAYAVRSLAGLIGKVGLLRQDQAAERRVRRAFRHYRCGDFCSSSISAFRRAHCHDHTPITAICCWDTVKSLGLPFPVLSRFYPMATEFHDHELGPSVKAAFHALALDEDRTAYRPILWRCNGDWNGTLEQVWFAGAHGDVGGERGCDDAAAPLSNLSMIWMLERAERSGLALPEGWREALAADHTAPMVGCRTGIARLFLLRAPRAYAPGIHGQSLHPSVAERMSEVPGYVPRAVTQSDPFQTLASSATSEAS